MQHAPVVPVVVVPVPVVVVVVVVVVVRSAASMRIVHQQKWCVDTRTICVTVIIELF